jgi:group I intron endonuclease
MNTGVYVIEHTASGKKYVGSSAESFKSRWGQHRHRLRKGTHHSSYLQHAWDKYGEDSFVFRIVKRTTPEEAVESEQAFIDLYQACDRMRGYNIAPIAGSRLGIKHTDEARANMSAAMMGRKCSVEHRARIGAASKGNKYCLGFKHTDEARANMSAAGKLRKPVSAETRAKMSAVHRGNKRNLGRKASAETRAKLSAAQMVRWAAKRTFLGAEQ